MSSQVPRKESLKYAFKAVPLGGASPGKHQWGNKESEQERRKINDGGMSLSWPQVQSKHRVCLASRGVSWEATWSTMYQSQWLDWKPVTGQSPPIGCYLFCIPKQHLRSQSIWWVCKHGILPLSVSTLCGGSLV